MGSPVLVVMGVSGSGKTTLGRSLARRTGWAFLDADALHSPESIHRMSSGIPLDDEARWPWLDRVAAWIADRGPGVPGIVACSALKRAYRDRLRTSRADVRFVYLQATPEQIADRLAARTGHFFPRQLVAAQFADLQEPGPDEDAIIVPIGQMPDAEVDAVLAALSRDEAPR